MKKGYVYFPITQTYLECKDLQEAKHKCRLALGLTGELMIFYTDDPLKIEGFEKI